MAVKYIALHVPTDHSAVQGHGQGSTYGSRLIPEARRWLLEHIGPEDEDQNVLSTDPYGWELKNGHWDVLRYSAQKEFILRIDTTELIAVEFKLRWL